MDEDRPGLRGNPIRLQSPNLCGAQSCSGNRVPTAVLSRLTRDTAGPAVRLARSVLEFPMFRMLSNWARLPAAPSGVVRSCGAHGTAQRSSSKGEQPVAPPPYVPRPAGPPRRYARPGIGGGCLRDHVGGFRNWARQPGRWRRQAGRTKQPAAVEREASSCRHAEKRRD